MTEHDPVALRAVGDTMLDRLIKAVITGLADGEDHDQMRCSPRDSPRTTVRGFLCPSFAHSIHIVRCADSQH